MNLSWQALKNRCRGLARRNLIGQLLLDMSQPNSAQIMHFISATRCSEQAFWETTPLGKSLVPLLKNKNVKASISFDNAEGLPAIYNRRLKAADSTEILIFLHDDVWLTDGFLLEKLRLALKKFDVVGVAGNRRRLALQPAWAFSRCDSSGFVWDWPWLSGAVAHGNPDHSEISEYGASPASCQLMDGVFLAAPAELLKASHVTFDERFTFDFYDLDFCRSATSAGLMLGTWPIGIIHESGGLFGKPSWEAARLAYFIKWKN